MGELCNALNYALTIVLGVAAFVLAYFLIMLVYFILRRRWSHAKFSAEVLVIGLLVLLSIASRVCYHWKDIAEVASTKLKDGFLPGLFVILRSIYTGISVVGFEGISEVDKIGDVARSTFLIGSSLLLGIVFLSIITSKVSYEFFSMIMLKLRRKKSANVFVFTSLNEDTLALARSIKKYYEVDVKGRIKDSASLSTRLWYFLGGRVERKEKINYYCVSGSLSQKRKTAGKKTVTDENGIKNTEKKSVFSCYFKTRQAGDEDVLRKENVKKDRQREDESYKKEIKKKNRETMKDFPLPVKIWFVLGGEVVREKAGIYYTPTMKKENRDTIWKRGKYIIIFGGNDVAAFDGKNQNCMEVIKEEYYYWSHFKADEKTLAERLHLVRCKNKDDYSRRFVVFAFARDEEGSPKEEENTESAISDIELRIKKSAKKDDELRIEYVILTKREINYQAYDKMTRELHVKYLTQKGDDPDKIKKYVLASKQGKKQIGRPQMKENDFYKMASIDVWNESNVAAKEVVKKIILDDKERIVGKKQEPCLVWGLGFGSSVQAIVDQLFVQIGSVNDQWIASGFRVEAFDVGMANISGLYRLTHPLCVCVDDEKKIDNETNAIRCYIEKIAPVYYEDTDGNIIRIEDHLDDLMHVIKRYVKDKFIRKESEKIKKEFLKNCGRSDIDDVAMQETAFPEFVFSSKSCYDMSFLKHVDMITGREHKPNKAAIGTIIKELAGVIGNDRDTEEGATICEMAAIIEKGRPSQEGLEIHYSPRRPDIIIISAGDDFRNIQLANAMINDIENEIKNNASAGTPGRVQKIIVYVRDKRNNALFTNAGGVWENNVLKIDGINVYIAGNTDNLYTYENTINHDAAEKYLFGYNYFSEALKLDEKTRKYMQLLQARQLEEPENKEAATFICKWVNFTSVLWQGLPTDNGRSLLDAAAEMERALAVVGPHSDDDFWGNVLRTYKQKDFDNWWSDSKRDWSQASVYDRESNISAQMHNEILLQAYRLWLQEGGRSEEWLYSKLILLEHTRWVRFHIINGWNTDKLNKGESYKDELLRRHPCIVPYKCVPAGTVIYDLTNVIWAIYPAICERKEREKDEKKEFQKKEPEKRGNNNTAARKGDNNTAA